MVKLLYNEWVKSFALKEVKAVIIALPLVMCLLCMYAMFFELPMLIPPSKGKLFVFWLNFYRVISWQFTYFTILGGCLMVCYAFKTEYDSAGWVKLNTLPLPAEIVLLAKVLAASFNLFLSLGLAACVVVAVAWLYPSLSPWFANPALPITPEGLINKPSGIDGGLIARMMWNAWIHSLPLLALQGIMYLLLPKISLNMLAHIGLIALSFIRFFDFLPHCYHLYNVMAYQYSFYLRNQTFPPNWLGVYELQSLYVFFGSAFLLTFFRQPFTQKLYASI
ncbi:MAG TPA: hypothetical protein DCM08_01995 [Microscillaceae bacterium]|nr:hypothetical protein [Microscillaceae bacterium]